METPGPTQSSTTSDALLRAWHPVALSSEIGEEPVQVWLLGEAWAVVRDGHGLRAFLDRCPHRLAPLTAGTMCGDGSIQCGYHGWQFGVAGECTFIPALGTGATLPPRARLTVAGGVADEAGIIWLAPLQPRTKLPDMSCPPGGHIGSLVPSRAPVDPGEMIDNFLDVAHFPFVHAATFGVEGSDEVEEYEISPTDFGFVASTEHEFANHEDPGVKAGIRPLRQRRRMTYDYTPPYSATLKLDYLDAEGSNLIVYAIQPERTGSSRVYTSLLHNDVPVAAMPEALEFEQRVLDEDLAIQQRMHVTMPLDLTTEVHTKADRLTIELRRCLARFLQTP